MGGSHWNDLHGFAMMSRSRVRGLHPSAKEVFYSTKDQRRMVDCIYLNAEERGGHLRSRNEPARLMGRILDHTCLAIPYLTSQFEVIEPSAEETRL